MLYRQKKSNLSNCASHKYFTKRELKSYCLFMTVDTDQQGVFNNLPFMYL